MKDTDKASKNKNDKSENLIPIEAEEIVIDCRGFDTKVLIDGREIYLEYFRVELDINGAFTKRKMGFRPTVLFGVRAKRVRFLQSEKGVKYRGAITEVGIIEDEGKFMIEYRSDDPDAGDETCYVDPDDKDRPDHLRF